MKPIHVLRHHRPHIALLFQLSQRTVRHVGLRLVEETPATQRASPVALAVHSAGNKLLVSHGLMALGIGSSQPTVTARAQTSFAMHKPPTGQLLLIHGDSLNLRDLAEMVPILQKLHIAIFKDSLSLWKI